MDEENKGFPIPANREMFGDEGDTAEVTPVPNSDYFLAFANDAGDKAVIVTPIETIGGEIVERHGLTEMEEYAKTLMDTGDDPMELQIGSTFEGETAEADANAEAMRLDEEYAPGEGAADEDIIAALDDARANTGANIGPAEEPEDDIPFPLNGPLGVDEAGDEPAEDTDEENTDEESEDIENEPMLDQLKKAKK